MKIVIAILALLQLLDFTTTAFALQIGGAESNPLIIAVLQSGGWPAIALAKMGIVVGLILVAVLTSYERQLHKIVTIMFAATIPIWLCIVLWNVYNIGVLISLNN